MSALRYRVHTFARRPDGSRDSFVTVTCNATRDGLGVRFNGQVRKVRRDREIGSYIEWHGDLFKVQEVED